MTRTPLSRSEGQRSTCWGGTYFGRRPTELATDVKQFLQTGQTAFSEVKRFEQLSISNRVNKIFGPRGSDPAVSDRGGSCKRYSSDRPNVWSPCRIWLLNDIPLLCGVPKIRDRWFRKNKNYMGYCGKFGRSRSNSICRGPKNLEALGPSPLLDGYGAWLPPNNTSSSSYR